MSADLPLVSDPIFFLDYDGTLAPIVEDPAAAFPHDDVPELLEQLERRYPLWIVTGRHLRDLPAFLDMSLPAIGLHGAQQGVIGAETSSLMPESVASALTELRASVPALEGLRVEDKEKAFAVHYRQVADTDEAREKLEEWTADLPEDIESVWGKKVVELRARGLNKGVAVNRIAAEHPRRTPVYIGDDVTDEDAFRALGDGAVTIKVGDGETAAAYQLGDVEDVVAYLSRYV